MAEGLLKALVLALQLVPLVLKAHHLRPLSFLLILVRLCLPLKVLDLQFEVPNLLLKEALLLHEFFVFLPALVAGREGLVLLEGHTGLQTLDLVLVVFLARLELLQTTPQKMILRFTSIATWR